jgi:hypothetical protein
MKCPECNGAFVRASGACETCVGFFSPPGHDHNRNCLTRDYVCAQGHQTKVALIRTCPADGCDWRGKTSCFCCKRFVEAWPEVEP